MLVRFSLCDRFDHLGVIRERQIAAIAVEHLAGELRGARSDMWRTKDIKVAARVV